MDVQMYETHPAPFLSFLLIPGQTREREASS